MASLTTQPNRTNAQLDSAENSSLSRAQTSWVISALSSRAAIPRNWRAWRPFTRGGLEHRTYGAPQLPNATARRAWMVGAPHVAGSSRRTRTVGRKPAKWRRRNCAMDGGTAQIADVTDSVANGSNRPGRGHSALATKPSPDDALSSQAASGRAASLALTPYAFTDNILLDAAGGFVSVLIGLCDFATFFLCCLPSVGPVERSGEGEICDAIALDRRKDRIDGRRHCDNGNPARRNASQSAKSGAAVDRVFHPRNGSLVLA